MNHIYPSPATQSLYAKICQKTFINSAIKLKTLFLLFILTSISMLAQSQGTWTALTNLAPNANQGVMHLLSDGTILCKTGSGGASSGNLYNKLTPNSSGSYTNGTWTSIAPMNKTRRFYSSQLLFDGRLYVCGGEYGSGAQDGEIYNPATNTWSMIPSPILDPVNDTLEDPNSEILEDGRILQQIIEDGNSSRTCRIYNPATNSWTNGGTAIYAMGEATWHKLPDGSILTVRTNNTNSQRYFPATNTWVADATVPVNLYSNVGSETGGAAMLPDGRIFFVGGSSETAIYTPSGTSAIGSWAAGPVIPGSYGQSDGSVSIGRDGIVLFTASPEPFTGNVFNNPTRFYEYDYVSNTITQILAPTGASNLPNNTCYEVSFLNLPNGQILCGIMGNNQYYVYTPAGSTLSSFRPVINSTSADCSSFIAYGTNFNGRSLGTVYGDDWQMSTNFPVVRLTSGGGTVYYAKTFNWNSYLMRRTAPDTVHFDVPSGLPNGTYNMNIIANGASSLTESFNTYPSLTSDLTPPSVCSGHPFIYLSTYDRGCVSRTWTRAAVVGISNAAITTPQSTNINETLINTTGTPKTVNYVFTLSNQGYSHTQTVSVVVNPSPTVSMTTSASSVCNGNTVTLTAFGASTYAWDPGTATGASAVFSPVSNTTYTVTGTNTFGCTDAASGTIFVNQLPVVTTSTIDNDLCPGQSTNLSSTANTVEHDSLFTTLEGGNSSQGNAFDIHAYKTITITDFKMNMLGTGADSAEVWYNPGGYGNANVTSTAGWFKLGATVPINNLGTGNLTLIPTTVNLTIPAGSTYGIIVTVNGSNTYTNGTLVGAAYKVNPDLYITQGHGGSAFGGNFSMINSPRIFNGEVIYNINNGVSGYAWTPAAQVTSPTLPNTVATPTATTTAITTYTMSVTDGNGCVGTSSVDIYTNDLPGFNSISASPASICAGGNSQLNSSISTSESGQNLMTTLEGGNGFAGNVFDITANKPIRITNVRMNILSGDSAEVWYKAGGYGNVALNSSVGWTKLGNTVHITPLGAGNLTTIPTSANLDIPMGQTYGIMITCNGSNYYTNGTAVGNIAAQNPDLKIKEGHGGDGFGGVFNFNNSPRIFNGQIDYLVFNDVVSYSWSPTLTLSNPAISNPVANPHVTTNYTLTVVDINGCTNSSTKKLYVNPLPQVLTSVTPTTICPGDSAQLDVTPNVSEVDSLFTTLVSDNGFGPNGGVVFDITTTKQLSLQRFKMNIDAGATQAKVFYKVGGYGNANVTSTAGWVQLGPTITISPSGIGNLTDIPLGAFLSIPAGSTYGIIVTTDGDVNYTNGSAVGNVYASNPDLSIKEGHGGSGFNGVFNFINSPRVFNGEITYQVSNTPYTVQWTPNTNMNNAFLTNPKAAPLSNTIYNVTVTDVNGCVGTGSAGVNVSPLPTLGSASASPSSICVGSNISLAYTAPTGNACFGAFQSGFAGTYAPANWTTSLVNSNGTVNTSLAPNQITLTSSDGLGALSGQTNYSIVIPCNGILSFNWDYTTNDGVQFDYPRYSINGGAPVIFPTFQSNIGDPKHQIGTFNLSVSAGQTFVVQAYSVDNMGGACTIKLNNFKAPYQSASGQSVVWYNAAVGGLNLGNGNPQTLTPVTTGTFTYYAQVTSAITGCTNTSRLATNSVVINPIPNVTVSATQNAICVSASTTLTANGASTYVWQPGALTGSSVIVTPASTTTYTVTGTGAGGCTSTTMITITVNPLPVITGSASPGIVCPGGAVTLTGTTPGMTWNWQPGNLNGSPVIVNPLVQTTYTVTATSAAGCTKTQTFVILMNPVPTVGTTVTPSATFCAGGSATITANGASTYSWQPGGAIGANLIVTLANTYTVTGTNAQGCTATATRVITVNSLPAVGTTATATTICSGSSTTLTGTGAVTYTWQPGALSGTSVVVSPTSTTTYTVTGTNANGCVNTATRLITVNTSPTVGTTVTNASICAGNSTSITGTGANTYSWQPGALSGTTINVSPAATTTYTVTGTAANGCTGTNTRLITVNTANINASVVSNPNICIGNSAVIQATGGVSYVWQPGGATAATITVSPVATTTYTVTGTSANGCTKTSTVTINVGSVCNGSINLKLYIEGYYAGGGFMAPVLMNQSVAGATSTQTDTITVQLRNTTAPYTVANTIKTILNTDGTAFCNFTTTGTYYLVVKHRNGLETWSANPVAISVAPATYDFSNAASKAYGSNQVALGGGVFGFYAGDFNSDENIDLADLAMQEIDITLFAFGYYGTDINGDGNVDILDSPTVETNINNFIFSAHP